MDTSTDDQADSSRTSTAIATMLLIAVCVVGIFDHDLWNPHEHRVAAIVKEMAESRDYVVPTLNGEPFLEKPPLYYAVAATLLRVFGGDPARTIRTASLLFGLVALVSTARIAFRLGGPRAAFVASAVLVTTIGHFRCTNYVMVDPALAASVALAFLALVEFRGGRTGWRFSFWLCVGAAFLAKGAVGPALVLPAVVVLALWESDLGLLWRLAPVRGSLIVWATAAAWLVPLGLRGNGLLEEFLLDQNLGRFVSGNGATRHHDQGPLFYLPGIALILLPWTPGFLVWFAERRKRGQAEHASLERLAIAWVVTGVGLLTLSRTKRELYAYPLLAGFALLAAAWMSSCDRVRGDRVWTRVFLGLTAVMAPAMFVGWLDGRFEYPAPWITFPVATAVAVVGWWSVRRLERRPAPFGTPAYWLAPALLFIQGAVVIIPPVDAYTSHSRGMGELDRLLPRDVPLAGAAIGETFLGSLSFTTGRRIRNFNDPEELEAYLSSRPPGLLLVRMKRWPFVRSVEDVASHVVARVPIAGEESLAVLRPSPLLVVKKPEAPRN